MPLNRQRAFRKIYPLRVFGMAGFVVQHLRNHCATFVILLGQFFQMILQVFADLIFSGGDKSQADFVAH